MMTIASAKSARIILFAETTASAKSAQIILFVMTITRQARVEVQTKAA
jgi:hypothetical protein